MTAEDKLIEKLKQATPDIKPNTFYKGTVQWDELTFKLNITGAEIELLIASLEQEIELAEITDADIEAFANKIDFGIGIEAKLNKLNYIYGAKALRDGKIKHTEK